MTDIQAKAREIALRSLERAEEALNANKADDCLAYCRTAETVLRIANEAGREGEWAGDGPVAVPRLV